MKVWAKQAMKYGGLSEWTKVESTLWCCLSIEKTRSHGMQMHRTSTGMNRNTRIIAPCILPGANMKLLFAS